MELEDDKKDFLNKKGEPKGVNLRKITQLINSGGVTFSVWEKRNDGKGIGKLDWTPLMGAEKKLLNTLPDKLQSNTEEIIHQDTAATVIKLWKGSGDRYFRPTKPCGTPHRVGFQQNLYCWIIALGIVNDK
ncbi:Hypothetical predicted protein, partial [Paramuricea clavata]